MKQRHHKGQEGVSLLELLLVLVLLGGLVLVFNMLGGRGRLEQQHVARLLGLSLHQARSEAISRNRHVGVFIEPRRISTYIDTNKNRRFDANEPLVRRVELRHDYPSVVLEGALVGRALLFYPTGVLRGFQNGRITIRSRRAPKGIEAVLSVQGRLRLVG